MAPDGSRCTPAGQAALPGDLGGEAGIEADRGPPAEMPQQLAGVGAGVPLIAGAASLAADIGPAGDDRLELVQDVPYGRGFTTADVVGFAERGPQGGNGRIHTVRDERVAAHL